MATLVVSPELLDPVAMTWFDRQAAFVGSDADHDFAFAAATGYRATLDTRLDALVTAVLEPAGDTPIAFAPIANYPNPFNSATVITFTLDADVEGVLTIYDVTGRRVRILTRGSLKAGNYALRWDGLDDEGRRVASGVYLAQLVTPKLRQSRRMTLLK